MDLPNSHSTPQTVVGNCLRCDGLVRIPVAADPSSQVRCPRCSEMFTLGEVLEQAAPSLELVDRPVTKVEQPAENEHASYNAENGKFEVPSVIKRGAIRKKRGRRKRKDPRMDKTWKQHSSNTDIVDIEIENGDSFQSISVADANGTSQPPKISLDPNPKPAPKLSERERDNARRREASSKSKGKKSASPRKSKRPSKPNQQRSPAFEFLKIIVGAFLALPVAQLMIWWIVGSDPLNFGPAVSGVVPIVVPEKFRAPTSENPKPAAEETDDQVTPPQSNTDPDSVQVID